MFPEYKVTAYSPILSEQKHIQSAQGLRRYFILATCSTWSAGATVNHVTISAPRHPDPSRAMADRGHGETRGDSAKHEEAGKWSPALASLCHRCPINVTLAHVCVCAWACACVRTWSGERESRSRWTPYTLFAPEELSEVIIVTQEPFLREEIVSPVGHRARL